MNFKMNSWDIESIDPWSFNWHRRKGLDESLCQFGSTSLWPFWALFFICCFVCFYFVGQKFLQFVSEMCLASVVLHRSWNHYLCWGLNSDSFHTIGEGHNPIVGVYIPILRNPTKGRMTISNLRNLDPTTFGKYDFTVFFVKVGTFFRGNQKVSKSCFSPWTGSGEGWG